jgi:hypothetical protein
MKTSELENFIYKNYDWSKINYENTTLYIPPIKYGKVVKIQNGNIVIISTILPYIDDTKDETPIYRFNIYLDGISLPKHSSFLYKDNSKILNNELSKFIFGKVVQLKSIKTDKNGYLYATIFLDSINVNEWMIEHKYAIKSKKEAQRRKTENDETLYMKESNYLYIDSSLFSEVHERKYKSYSKSKILNEDIQNSIDSQKTILPNIYPNINNYLKKSDCFLSHNWGESKSNHKKVALINKALQKRGLITWFDENEIEGNIRYKMAEGIDNTMCVLVFITKEYRDKVNGIDMKDNCKYEFTYAVNQLGSQNMLPVVMEKDMCNTHEWKGELGAALGSMLYIDFTDEKLKNHIELEKKYDDLYNIIKKFIKK